MPFLRRRSKASRRLRQCPRLPRRRRCYQNWFETASGGEAYFTLAMEWQLWHGLRSFPGDPCRRTFRPIEASKAAIRNGCFTSTPAVQSAKTGHCSKVRRMAQIDPENRGSVLISCRRATVIPSSHRSAASPRRPCVTTQRFTISEEVEFLAIGNGFKRPSLRLGNEPSQCVS